MERKREILDEIARDFDLARIKNLSLPEKFKLVHYVKLIHREALFASREGMLNLEKSPFYTANKTYNLFAMLVVNGIKPDIFKEIVLFETIIQSLQIFCTKNNTIILYL